MQDSIYHIIMMGLKSYFHGVTLELSHMIEYYANMYF